MMQCNFNDYPCHERPLAVLLVICDREHIRENYLCLKHHTAYMTFLQNDRLNCAECFAPITREWLQEAL